MNSRQILLKTPARVCLFGDHQDYLGLPVIAATINRFITLKADVISEEALHIHFLDIEKKRIIKYSEIDEAAQQNDFLLTALQVLKPYGCEPNQGYDISITGNIPINAGLSSSSSLVVLWIQFLLKAFGIKQKITSNWIAKIAYQIEVLEHKGPGGLMDQYIISIGNMLYIDSLTGDYTLLNTGLSSLIIAESGVPKHTQNILKYLKTYALSAIDTVKNRHPEFDISQSNLSDYEKYQACVPEHLKVYFYAVLKNYDITKKALKLFKIQPLDVESIGALMTSHHIVLRDLLKITVPEIDKLIDCAMKNGALGAKIVGSGGGGCTVTLVKPEEKEAMITQLKSAGAKAVYEVKIVTKSNLFYD
jgi:galactokinase